MKPEEYLAELGIHLKATVLITYIDGTIRNPNLCSIMRGYAECREKKDNSQKDNGEFHDQSNL